jgi:hypothetical protein
MSPQAFQALTITSKGGLLRAITCECGVGAPFDPANPPAAAPPFKRFNGLWDTGATGCAITQKVVDDCGLKPHRVDEVRHGGGKQMCEFFLLSLFLPNGVVFGTVEASKLEIDGAHILIGMDIITAGDTTITNINNQTVFSFRVPSIGAVDYVKHSQELATRPKKGKRKRRR